jgi:hypothetical protein
MDNKKMYIYLIVLVFSASQIHSQIISSSFKSVQFGIGEVHFPKKEKRANFRIQFTGGKFVPYFLHQIGFNSALSVPYGGGGSHNTMYFNISKGFHYKIITILPSVGPSLSLYKIDNSQRIDDNDFLNVKDNNWHWQLGLNGNISIILQPISKFGLGVDFFVYQFKAGRIYGSTFVLHFSNLKI